MDYKQTEGSATSWRRARQVVIHNPLNGVPSIAFQEEDAVQMGSVTMSMPGPPTAVTGQFDAAAQIPLINPQTGESLGQVATQGDLYVILYSLYLQLAAARDAAAAAPAPAPPVTPPPAPPPPADPPA